LVVDSSIVRWQILMTVSFLPTLSTINPSSKQREVIFLKTGTPKFAGQYKLIIPYSYFVTDWCYFLSSFQENSLTLTSCSRLVFLDTLEQLFPNESHFPKVPVCSPGSQISNSGLINNSDIETRNHLLTSRHYHIRTIFALSKEKNGPVLPQPTWISSQINKMPCLSHKPLSFCIQSIGATTTSFSLHCFKIIAAGFQLQNYQSTLQ